MTDDMPTVLAHIAQVVGWLPRHEDAAVDVRRGLVTIEARVAANSLSRGDLLGFQAHVRRLNHSPLRAVLSRRVGQLGQQYGL